MKLDHRRRPFVETPACEHPASARYIANRTRDTEEERCSQCGQIIDVRPIPKDDPQSRLTETKDQ